MLAYTCTNVLKYLRIISCAESGIKDKWFNQPLNWNDFVLIAHYQLKKYDKKYFFKYKEFKLQD